MVRLHGLLLTGAPPYVLLELTPASDLCTRNKKVFTHEHELFTQSTLRKHERYGDDNPGAVDQSGFKGHPECGFCRERFYDDDYLYSHCRDKHERCHICDRMTSGRQQQYYLDYNALEIHFSKDHFLCPDKECLEKKFVVFDSEMDLKAHQLETHPNGLSKDARRDARRVDMSGFDYRTSRPNDHRNERRGGRGGGRGRDPNVDPLPMSSAQPLRRDELAYQRQLAVHSAQSISTRTFGGQLSSTDTYTARPPADASEQQTVTAPREGASTRLAPSNGVPDLPPIDELNLTSSNSASTPQERARNLRHTALIERASNLLSGSSQKLATFRTKVSAFKSSSITASALIDSFFALFNCSSSDLGKLIRELAELFEIPSKSDELMKAWNDWRAINEDYPSLPGLTPASSAGGSGGKRVLKLKSATVQSSETPVNRGVPWNPSMGAPARSNHTRWVDPFPPMSNASQAGKSPPAWIGATAAARPDQHRPSPAMSRPISQPVQTRPNVGKQGLHGSDAFPALPAAQRPSMNVGKNPVRRDGPGNTNVTTASAWQSFGNGLQSGASNILAGDADADEDTANGKKKGKKKQTLIHWG